MFEIEALDFMPNIFILGGLIGIVEFFKKQNLKLNFPSFLYVADSYNIKF